MHSKTKMTIDDSQASELATVTFEGQDFTAGGFAVDVAAGRMIAYVGKERGHLALQTWNGQRIAGLVWTGRARGFHGVKLEAYQTTEPIAGFYWYGRGLGEGMILKLRRGRKA